MKLLPQFIDNTVIDVDGNRVGVIDEIMLRCDTGRITRVIVRADDRSHLDFSWSDFEISATHFILKRQAGA